jgi:acetyltransferase
LLILFSQMLIDLPEIRECDLNPVLVSHDHCTVVDARMTLDPAGTTKDQQAHDHLLLSPYPEHLTKTVLIDGREVVFRAIRPEDEPLWLDMFNSFSEETRRFRFFHVIKNISHEERIRYTFIDYNREFAIVPVINEDGVEKMLGAGRIQASVVDESAEFAIALRDEWQSRGLGEALFDYLIDIAHNKGWNFIHAHVLADNAKMINLFRKKGCRFEHSVDEGSYRVYFEIPP